MAAKPRQLDPTKGSISGPQIQTLCTAARRKGVDLQTIRDAYKVTSIRDLSRAQASAAITRLTGQGLKHAPGQAPRLRRRPPAPGTFRMLAGEHVEQIARLAAQYFRGDVDKVIAWLRKNYEECHQAPPGAELEDVIQALGTAQRAGEIIAVLKGMTGGGPNLPTGSADRRHHNVTPADPEDMTMPFGKHRGRTLGEIADDDILHLDWLAGTEIRNRRLQQAVGEICRRRSHEIESALAGQDS